MSKSIISNDRECLVCKTTLNLHKHHIFYGMSSNKKNGQRAKSEKYGLWVYLCYRHHNKGEKESVHNHPVWEKQLQKMAQEKFEETYTDLEFIKIFGRNYL